MNLSCSSPWNNPSSDQLPPLASLWLSLAAAVWPWSLRRWSTATWWPGAGQFGKEWQHFKSKTHPKLIKTLLYSSCDWFSELAIQNFWERKRHSLNTIQVDSLSAVLHSLLCRTMTCYWAPGGFCLFSFFLSWLKHVSSQNQKMDKNGWPANNLQLQCSAYKII